MKLACNYYTETEMLVKNGSIDLDYYKYPALGFHMDILQKENLPAFKAFASRLRDSKPVLLHGLYPPAYDLTSPDFMQQFNAEAMDEYIAATGSPGVSMHPCAGEVDTARTGWELSSTVADNLRVIVERYQPMDFVSVENLDSPRYGALLDPAVISAIVERSGASLLLDISHAYCASYFTGQDFYEYLHRLPLESVSEIHINGWHLRNGEIMSHMKINPAGYQALKHVLNYCQPQIITVEYGRHNDRLGTGCPVMSPDTVNEAAMAEITEQINEVRELIGKESV